MATLTVQQASQAGFAPAYTAAAGGGDVFANDGRVVLHVKNGGAGSINVTINSQVPCNQGVDHDLVVAVGAGAEKIVGPFPSDRWNNASGQVEGSYSGVTSVTVAALKV